MRLKATRRMTVFVWVMLIIEFLDEFTFGVNETAWPLIRDELGLDYVQIGLLLGIPILFANLIEPIFGLLADTHWRKPIMVGGGLLYGCAIIWVASSQSFAMMMLAFFLLMPAAGAFVSFGQASLMDYQPDRHDQNMARWTLAGSLGVVTGPIALGAAVALGAGWRSLFASIGIMMILAALYVWRMPPNAALKSESNEDDEEARSMRENGKLALIAIRRPDVVRWLTLLQFSDLMLDVLFGYLALYFVDVVGVTESEAGIAVLVWTGVGLIGDFLLIPLLERLDGLIYLRFSVLIEMMLYPAFLLIDNIPIKLLILGVIGLFNAGWYSILSGKLYSSLPNQSGVVLVLSNIAGLFGGLMPALIGIIATRNGLDNAMWIILLAPIALMIGLPHRSALTVEQEE